MQVEMDMDDADGFYLARKIKKQIANRKSDSMEIDTDKLVENAIRDGLREACKSKFQASYNNPLDKLLDSAVTKHAGMIQDLLSEAIGLCAADPDFRAEIKSSVRVTLAKILVQRFGGELEKQVNSLKSDPITRARIVTAIDEIVKQKIEA